MHLESRIISWLCKSVSRVNKKESKRIYQIATEEMVPDWPKKCDFLNIGTLYMKHDEAAVIVRSKC